MERRGPRALILLLLFALTFWGGIQWERQDCFIDWPNSWDDVNDAIRCPDTPVGTATNPDAGASAEPKPGGEAAAG